MAGKYFWFWKASMNRSSRCTQPLEALRVTAMFMVDSRRLEARRSQKSMRPMPVPIVRMFPLKDTDLVRALVSGKNGREE